jgi:hypothetical protein
MKVTITLSGPDLFRGWREHELADKDLNATVGRYVDAVLGRLQREHPLIEWWAEVTGDLPQKGNPNPFAVDDPPPGFTEDDRQVLDEYVSSAVGEAYIAGDWWHEPGDLVRRVPPAIARQKAFVWRVINEIEP